jgi:hypothetical protein
MSGWLKRIGKWALRLAVGLTLAAVLLAGAFVALIAWPTPLFAHHIAHGDLELWSDRPFMKQSGHSVLEDVAGRLAKSPVPFKAQRRRIFIVNSDWRRRLLFLNRMGAGGLNYYPFTGNVFIRAASVEAGLVVGPGGQLVKEPRTLAYYAAHEIGHSIIGEAVGIVAHYRQPVWVREGLADHIGLPGAHDAERLGLLLRMGDPSMDPKASGLYARYRYLVALALKKGWRMEEVLASRLSLEDAEALLLPKQ